MTTAPAITFHDAGDLASAAVTLGIPHPPGYPLYTMIAFAFAKLPFATVPFRIALLSGTAAAVAVFFFVLIGWHLTNSIPASVLGALCIAFSEVFWSRATFIELYSLNMLFVAVLLYLLFLWEHNGYDNATLLVFFFMYGLSLTHHPTIILLVPAAAFFILDSPVKIAIDTWLKGLLLFVLPLSIYVYEPLRAAANPAKNWGDPATLQRWFDHILVAEYRGSLGRLPSSIFIERLGQLPSLFAGQFSIFLCALGVIGLIILFRRNTKHTITLILSMLAIVLFFGRNTASDSVVFNDNFMTAYAIWGLFIIAGIAFAINAAAPAQLTGRTVVITFLAAAIFITTAGRYPLENKHSYYFAERYTTELMDSLPKNSILLTSNDNYLAPIEYMQIVEHHRPDITAVSMGQLSLDWYQRQISRKGLRVPAGLNFGNVDSLWSRIISANRDRPIFLTSLTPEIVEDFNVTYFRGSLFSLEKPRADLPDKPLLAHFLPGDSLDNDAFELHAEAYLNLGAAHLYNNNLDQSLKLFAIGRRRAPRDVRYYPAIAQVLLKNNKPKQAYAILKTGQALDLAYPSTYSYMVLAAGRLHMHDIEYEAASRSIGLKRDDVDSLLYLSALDFETDEFVKALTLGLEALSYAPDDVRPHMIVALSAERIPDYALAEREWREVINISTDPETIKRAKRHLKIFAP